MKAETRKKLLLLGLIGMAMFFASLVFYMYFVYDPVRSQPNPASGIIYEMTQGRYVFYMTAFEYYLFYFLLLGGWSMAAISLVALNIIEKPWRKVFGY